MDFSTPTDRMRLDNLSKPNEAPRPTIPYAQLPRPALPALATNVSSRPNDAVTSAADRPSFDPDSLDSATSYGHRRRRSSLMNSPVGHSNTRTRAHSGADGKRWATRSEDGGRHSADDSMSGSDEVELDNYSDDGLEADEETGLTGQARQQRRRRKRRNTLLDQRIAPDSKFTEADNAEADQSLIKRLAINGLLIGLW
jgi:solute carrier family 35 protein C2